MTDDKDDKGFWQDMKRHPIFMGCFAMLVAMVTLFAGCIGGIVTTPFK